MKRYAQIKTLTEIFDLSEDFFKVRMARKDEIADPIKKPFKEGVFFFIPPTTSATKKAVLWDIQAVDSYIRGDYQLVLSVEEPDDELADLLARSKNKNKVQKV